VIGIQRLWRWVGQVFDDPFGVGSGPRYLPGGVLEAAAETRQRGTANEERQPARQPNDTQS